MKVLSTSLLVLVVVCGAAFGQIPNAGFESWTAVDPDTWATSNAAPVYTNVTKSTTAHSGSSAARGEVVSIGGPVPIQPVLQSGADGEGFPINFRPESITGWYQFSPLSGDRFGINVALFKGGVGGTTVALAASADPTAHGAYVQFNVPFQYFTADIPDTCVIQHQIIGPTTGATWHVGSSFLLDDLAFSGTNDIGGNDALPQEFKLEQNFPNPFNPATEIRYQSPVAGDIRLVVHDLLGREVAVLEDGRKDAGAYQVTFDATGLASGVYYCRLEVHPLHAAFNTDFRSSRADLVQTRALMLLK